MSIFGWKILFEVGNFVLGRFRSSLQVSHYSKQFCPTKHSTRQPFKSPVTGPDRPIDKTSTLPSTPRVVAAAARACAVLRVRARRRHPRSSLSSVPTLGRPARQSRVIAAPRACRVPRACVTWIVSAVAVPRHRSCRCCCEVWPYTNALLCSSLL